MATKKIPFNYDINRMLAVDLIAIIHIDDYDTRFLELTMFDDGTPFSVEGCTATSRFVTIQGSYLLSDNVPCEATGNTITIPIDAAAVQMMACDIKIEVNIVDGEKILTLPFPLWVRVRGSILETAHVTPESQGTIPELLKEAAEELERVRNVYNKTEVNNLLSGKADKVSYGGDNELVDAAWNGTMKRSGYRVTTNKNAIVDANSANGFVPNARAVAKVIKDFVTSDQVYDILDDTLQGNPYRTPSLHVIRKGNSYALVYDDSEDVQHELFDFSNLPSGGTSDYTELENKPSINNVTLQGNKSSNDLGLQPLINNYFTVENNEYLSYNFNSVSVGVNSVLYCVPFNRISNFPNSLVGKISQSGRLYIFHYVHALVGGGARYLIRRIMGYDLNGKYAEFAQYCTVLDDNTVIAQSDWVELSSGGSQIVSGVVNQNGTITFTDSDGNTFTTSGGNLVTSGAQQISMGYDNGGFYFLFDDGQEVVNNGSN